MAGVGIQLNDTDYPNYGNGTGVYEGALAREPLGASTSSRTSFSWDSTLAACSG